MLFRSEPFCTLRRFAPKNALVKPAELPVTIGNVLMTGQCRRQISVPKGCVSQMAFCDIS